ncbi:hypothetical protein C0Q70_15976 [Pomacea canaliculata]|uniref:BACK domain-containing protein n=1 Tax=Pomacea canaliculata TaxID=400727 RepID=A0A2T7NNG7_POMCA|nr:hypothetical protein C0Q70_15976 [Pomacea canaliculata]
MFVEQAQKLKSGQGDKDLDAPFVLSDMTHEVFLTMMEFIYTNRVTLSSKTAIDVLATALEYGLDDLKHLCEDYLVSSLDVDNACDRIQAAQTYRLDDLKRKTLEYIEENTKAVLESKGFEEISEETLYCILESDNLMLDEMEVYQAVRRWASVNSAVSSKPISAMGRDSIKLIRLPLLSLEEISILEEENKKDHFLPVRKSKIVSP